MKTCAACQSTKPLSEFYRRKERNSVRSHCKTCVSVQNLGRYRRGTTKKTEPQYREANLKKNYGITTLQYEILLEAQGGACSICKGPALGKGRYHVDHDHNTGEIRGLLCHKCNVGLAMAGEKVENLQSMISYLQELT